MTANASLPEAAAVPGDDEPAAHASAACLRPYCSNPFAAFSAFSRVGGWTSPLPDAGAVPEGDATA